jgi:ParB family chromosome partitioning protein
MNVPITEIQVGERRREDMGDIAELAESISRFGLFHPLVVDESLGLIAGGRRLAACKHLGWERVPVRYFANLSDEDKQEIELEENIRRKDLTAYEESKEIVRISRLAEANESEFLPTVGKNGGRPVEPNSGPSIAARSGIPRSTIQRAQVHVDAVERYPELATASQKEAIQTAKALDSLPEEERPEALAAHITATERVTTLDWISRFSDAFYKFSHLVSKFFGDESPEQVLVDIPLRQAEWLISELRETASELQKWDAMLCKQHPQLKSKLRKVN